MVVRSQGDALKTRLPEQWTFDNEKSIKFKDVDEAIRFCVSYNKHEKDRATILPIED
jgi:hypothetical protein